MREGLRRVGRALFVGAAFLFLAISLASQREELLAFEWKVEPVRLGLSTLVLIAVLAVGVWIWARVLRHFGAIIAYRDLARIWFLSSLGRYIPGKVWQFVGVAEMSRAASIPALLGITSLLVYMGFLVLAAGLVSIYLLPSTAAGPLADVFPVIRLCAPLLLIATHPRVLNSVISVMSKMMKRQLAPWGGSWTAALALVAVAAGVWVGFGAAFHLFLSSLAEVPSNQFGALTAVYALSFLAGHLAFVAPAGLGAKDGAMALLLSVVLPTPIGVAAALSVAARIWSIVGDVVPALFFLLGSKTRGATSSRSVTP